MKTRDLLLIGLVLVTAAGCNGMASAHRGSKADPVLNMLHRGVIELNENIEELQQHIAELKQLPIDPDARVQELQGLDLAAWELHLQQWMVQRDNLTSSLESIEQAQTAPQDKAAIGKQWSERRATYMKTIEELRTHRRNIEHKRTDVESQLLERYFQ